MPLPVWLLVYAIIETLYLIKSAWAAYNRESDIGSKTLSYDIVSNQLFLLIWNIVGAVALYRDSTSCLTQLYPLWTMTLCILVIQWKIMCIVACLICCICCGTCLSACSKPIHEDKTTK